MPKDLQLILNRGAQGTFNPANLVSEQAGGVVSQDHRVYEVSEGARLHFIKFETKYIEGCLDFVRGNLVGSREKMAGKVIKATGGGAYKYTKLLQEKLGLS
uniref:Uncharacterized protein n=1 Tax=Timema poppense TaxID=170557 RepID=A0A7R9D9T3_TIMPO|nr:unnamed protein product [Timema poppensis]